MKIKLSYFAVLFPIHHPAGSCRVCGCTDDHACDGGCYWMLPHICNRCIEGAEDILTPPMSRLADFRQVLDAETNTNILTFALHNATGDWRRVAINKRIKALLQES